MTLTKFLPARIAGDEEPDPEALKMDARFSPSEDGFTVEYQWARLIRQASGLPVRQRRGSGLARGAPSPARRCRLHSETQDRGPACQLWFRRWLLR
jgi:hypothetical protein